MTFTVINNQIKIRHKSSTRRPRVARAPLTPVLLLHCYTRSVSENIKGGIISCRMLLDTHDCQKTRVALALHRPTCHCCFSKQTKPFKFKQSKQELQVTTFWTVVVIAYLFRHRFLLFTAQKYEYVRLDISCQYSYHIIRFLSNNEGLAFANFVSVVHNSLSSRISLTKMSFDVTLLTCSYEIMLNFCHSYYQCIHHTRLKVKDMRESVLFIGTQFSNLYTAVDTHG